jgi:hypothetical protein
LSNSWFDAGFKSRVGSYVDEVQDMLMIDALRKPLIVVFDCDFTILIENSRCPSLQIPEWVYVGG